MKTNHLFLCALLLSAVSGCATPPDTQPLQEAHLQPIAARQVWGLMLQWYGLPASPRGLGLTVSARNGRHRQSTWALIAEHRDKPTGAAYRRSA